MTEEIRISRLLSSLSEVVRYGGQHEQTKIVPNLEVIDDNPTGLTNYILVEDEGGYTIPVVRLSGVAYATGDLVNVLFIEGTEAIALGQGSGSSGSATTTVRIDDTDSPYTAAATVIFCDTDGGVITVNLPAGIEGTHYKIANCGTSANDVTVDGNGGETVYGAATQTLSDGEVIDLHYNATEGWW